MSHFTVAVLHHKNQSVDDLLEKFYELNECLPEEMVFNDRTKYLEELYHKPAVGYAQGDSIVEEWEDCLWKEITETEYNKGRSYGDYDIIKRYKHDQILDSYLFYDPESIGWHKINTTCDKIYPTLKEFAKSRGLEENNGKFGYWMNPYAKYDYYSIGGDWNGLLKLKDGCSNANYPDDFDEEYKDFERNVSEAYVKDVDFSYDPKVYKKYIRRWQVIVDKKPLRKYEKAEDFNLNMDDYLKKRYLDAETYANEMCSFSTFAVVTPDGVWHAAENMGWFCATDGTYEEERAWVRDYKKNFIDSADEDTIISIVDCHI